MSGEKDPSPYGGKGFPYNIDRPATTNPMLAKSLSSPGDETIFAGIVTDSSSHHHSCTVTIPLKTARFGIPCLWTASSINRWGGVVDTSPPELGSVVAVYVSPSGLHGFVLGQLPGILKTPPDKKKGSFIDPFAVVSAFNEDTSQIWKELGTGGAAMNGYQRHLQDIFPGEKAFHNELGVVVGILRTMAMLRGSELAKIEAFSLDDLLRIVGHNLDVWTCGSDFSIREDKGGIIGSELNESMSHIEAQGNGGKLGYMMARRRVLGGAFGDVRRDFVLIPSDDPEKPDTGLSELYQDSGGLVITRSIAGGGIVKSRSIGVPRRKREAQDPLGAKDKDPEVSIEDLVDFDWDTENPVERAQQLRDAFSWIMNKQGLAKLSAFGDKEKVNDWEIADDSPDRSGAVNSSSKGADVGIGGHLSEEAELIDLSTNDKNNEAKPRVVRINDAWVFVLPDGSVSIRDGHGACFTLSRGCATVSPPKDINLVAGRNINLFAGKDIVSSAYGSVDLSALHGQMRVFSRKTGFMHSEDGGLLFSTNNEGIKSNPEDEGEKFNSGGIIFKAPKSDVSFYALGQYSHVRDTFSVGPMLPENKPDIFFEAQGVFTKAVDQVSWKVGKKYMAMFDDDTVLVVGGTVEAQKNFDAPNGTVRVNKKFEDFQKEDFCLTPGATWLLLEEEIGPFYNNTTPRYAKSISARNAARKKCGQSPSQARTGAMNRFNWKTLHGMFDVAGLKKVGFTFRNEKEYGTDDKKFGWTEQAWMREWTAAQVWGDDVSSQKADESGETFPYPGKDHWKKGKCFYKYGEVNVDSAGNMVPRERLENSGEFTGYPFSHLGRHP